MNLEFFIARRIILQQKGDAFVSRPIVRIAQAGVALGFAVMVVAIAVVTGFKKEIRDKVIGFGSHIQISNFDENNSFETRPVSRNQPFLKTLADDPAIGHVQVFATKAGIIKTSEAIEGVVAKGIGVDFDWSFFRDKLISGKTFLVRNNEINDSIIISGNLADKLKLNTGDQVIMYFIQQPPRARKFIVSGIYKTGMEDFDNLFIFCDIAQLQKLNDWTKDQVGGFEITLKHFSDLNREGDKIYSLTGSFLNARTIREIYPQIFDWLGLQNINAVIIITLMVIVAGINMVSALLIIILERIRMIGTLKALGCRNISIRKIFFYVSLMLIAAGLLAGNIAGIGLCLLQKEFGIFHLDQQSYYLSLVPVKIDAMNIVLLNAGTLIACGLMMILPTLLITKISPVYALRFT
ncbi:MAG: ABC transporter permease [Bacteroidia bacterium]|nr:ABC transporter permease [Bacteroidia bacterium]